MTILSTQPIDADQLDLLDLVTDVETPLGKLHALDFMAACVAVGRAADGWVNPNAVSALLHERFGEIKPQWYSAQWAPACGPKGFLDKTKRLVQIDGKHSKNNGNKSTVWRRLRLLNPSGSDAATPVTRRPASKWPSEPEAP